MSTELIHIPVSQIKPGAVSLRKVQKDSLEFVELCESIRNQGVMNPINVQKMSTGEYQIVDGLHRWTACQAIGKETIPCQVLEISDETQLLEAQMIANCQRIETRRAEYADQINRLLIHRPNLTIAELSKRLGKSPTWLNDQLCLSKLDDATKELVNTGKMTATNAIQLAKLPESLRSKFLESAIAESPDVFMEKTNAEKRAYAKALREGKDPSTVKWEPTAHIRNKSEIKEAMDSPAPVVALLNAKGITDPKQVVIETLKWVVCLDDKSVEEQYNKEQARKAEAERKRKEAADEREKKKREDAANLAEQVRQR